MPVDGPKLRKMQIAYKFERVQAQYPIDDDGSGSDDDDDDDDSNGLPRKNNTMRLRADINVLPAHHPSSSSNEMIRWENANISRDNVVVRLISNDGDNATTMAARGLYMGIVFAATAPLSLSVAGGGEEEEVSPPRAEDVRQGRVDLVRRQEEEAPHQDNEEGGVEGEEERTRMMWHRHRQ